MKYDQLQSMMLLSSRVSSNLERCCPLKIICKCQRMWHRFMLCRFNRKGIFKATYIVLGISILVFIALYVYIHTCGHKILREDKIFQRLPYKCNNTAMFKPHDHTVRSRGNPSVLTMQYVPKVLLFAETKYSKLSKTIEEILVANRIKYKSEVIDKSLPLLTKLSKGKYAAIIFENIDQYLLMDKWNRELIDKYMKEYSVGLVAFALNNIDSIVKRKLGDFPLHIRSLDKVDNLTLNGENPVLRLTRAGNVLRTNELPPTKWSVFIQNHPTYLPLELVHLPSTSRGNEGHSSFSEKYAVSILDRGQYDGIHRVLFGAGMEIWLHHILLLDALSYVSFGRLSVSLERYIQIDIDDVFLGKPDGRLLVSDVQELLNCQNKIQRLIPGFKFTLGFCGKYFKHGNYYENFGDQMLIDHVNDFNWFGHLWNHIQPHKVDDVNQLVEQMELNKKFAAKHGVPLDFGYSVSPHHSGIFPVHTQLYDAWRKVWDVKVTSTEEYPQLRPARLRRGFIHKGIMVLPRQTCGLYTHTLYYDQYPKGFQVLENSIRGGQLFQTVVYNPISIFMTHQGNYAHDRLAPYTFESVLEFVRCWTHLELKFASPLELGRKYFENFPSEVSPLWSNPCSNKRLLEIWSEEKSCDSLPSALVIGPQKSGTTALYSFLSLHPDLTPNLPSETSFEEVQFFNSNNYLKGLDWYMEFFPPTNSSEPGVFFEKSASYFDSELVPLRVKTLLPSAKLITILIPPEERAYSWYHHMRAHSDPTSLSYSFMDVISADKVSHVLRSLRNRCLNPGFYAKILDKWLSYFPASHLHIIDGVELKENPVMVMNKVQEFLELKTHFNYSQHLKFNQKKGFYCTFSPETNRTDCLGKGKGRIYPKMQAQEQSYLTKFYRSANIELEKLLVKHNFPIPKWLDTFVKGS